MIPIPAGAQIWVACGATDMRRSRSHRFPIDCRINALARGNGNVRRVARHSSQVKLAARSIRLAGAVDRL